MDFPYGSLHPALPVGRHAAQREHSVKQRPSNVAALIAALFLSSHLGLGVPVIALAREGIRLRSGEFLRAGIMVGAITLAASVAILALQWELGWVR